MCSAVCGGKHIEYGLNYDWVEYSQGKGKGIYSHHIEKQETEAYKIVQTIPYNCLLDLVCSRIILLVI
jgi:hypothetical protein